MLDVPMHLVSKGPTMSVNHVLKRRLGHGGLRASVGAAVLATYLTVVMTTGAHAQSVPSKPNIVVIMADDVGVWNVSAYHQGMMGGRTPNIDRIGAEGARFTDYYGQQSCTAGRSSR